MWCYLQDFEKYYIEILEMLMSFESTVINRLNLEITKLGCIFGIVFVKA